MGEPSIPPPDTGEDCPICMAPMQEQEVARIPCSHEYHNTCLLEWSETSNTCPYCRAEFLSVEVVNEREVIRKYTVQPVKVVEEEEYDEEEEYQEEPRISRCVKCGSTGHETVLMLCDSCDDCYHSFCLDFTSFPTTGPFFCPTCVTLDNYGAEERTTVRTVASLRSRRRPNRRRRQLQTWTRAWERVRERTWSRLNADVYVPTTEERLTATQEQELRCWRVRMESRRVPRTQEEPTAAPIEDPETTALWRAFDRATRTLKANAPHSRTPSPVPTPPTQRRQKRPNRGSIVPSKRRHLDVSGPSFLSDLIADIRNQAT